MTWKVEIVGTNDGQECSSLEKERFCCILEEADSNKETSQVDSRKGGGLVNERLPIVLKDAGVREYVKYGEKKVVRCCWPCVGSSEGRSTARGGCDSSVDSCSRQLELRGLAGFYKEPEEPLRFIS